MRQIRPATRKLMKVTAMAINVLPPLGAAFMCFPIWLEQGSSKTVSGICLIVAALCVLPFLKQIKEYFKSPSVIVLWLVIAIAMTLMRNIINEMLIVSYVALISNCLGTLLYKLADYKREE